jgi:hypothetical protein
MNGYLLDTNLLIALLWPTVPELSGWLPRPRQKPLISANQR